MLKKQTNDLQDKNNKNIEEKLLINLAKKEKVC